MEYGKSITTGELVTFLSLVIVQEKLPLHMNMVLMLKPKLRHSDYFTEPRIQELAAKERAEPGYCRRVVDFVVGRKVVCILLSELLTGILPQVR
jgi:hypothetical protein